jgi:hypothetical protein
VLGAPAGELEQDVGGAFSIDRATVTSR